PKFCKKRTQQRRPRHAPIMGPQRAAQRLAAEPSAASFIRNRPTPAADLILPPIQLRPANAASADHDDAAVTSAMGADACRLGVGDENRHAIGMLVPSRSLELAGPTPRRPQPFRSRATTILPHSCIGSWPGGPRQSFAPLQGEDWPRPRPLHLASRPRY